MKKKQKAVIYIRVSDPEQLKGLSLEVQKELCVKWAKENDCQVVGVFEDGGRTGTKTVGRHALEDMIIYCQNEHVDVALVIDTDRIARNELDHFYIKFELSKAGTRLVAVNQLMIDDSPEGRFFETILAGTNAFYSRLLGRKVRKSLEKKCRDGHWPGWAPIGYINVNKGTKDKPNRVVKIDPNKHSLISELFRLYSTGNYSVDVLVDMMHEKGLRSKNESRIYRSTMYSILKNPFFIGSMRYKGQIFEGKHKPLTTPEIFEACQRVTQRHNHNACRRRKYQWLLSGFVYCHKCNVRLYCSWQKKKKSAYYHGNVQNGCKHYIPIGELEDKVAQEFKKIQFSKELTQKIIEKGKKLISQSRENREKETHSLRNAVKKLETKRSILEDHLLDQTINKETFKRKHDELALEIQNLENEIATIENQRGFDIDIISEILKMTQNIYQTFINANFKAKRHYLSIFFEKFEIKDREIAKTTYAPLFKHLLKTDTYRLKTNWLPLKDLFCNHKLEFEGDLSSLKVLFKTLSLPSLNYAV